MKTTFTLLFVLGSLSAFCQSSTLIGPNGNNGILSKNNTTISVSPGLIPPPVSGAGTRLMWIPAKSAFRAGTVESTHWDADSMGVWSTAFGFNTVAKGWSSTAFGYKAIAGGNYSIVWGYLTQARGNYSTAWGFNTTAAGDHSTALGSNTNAGGIYSIAGGYSTVATGFAANAWGQGANATGVVSTAWGNTTTASGDGSTALGEFNTAQSYASLVMGRYNVIAGTTGSWVTTDPLFVIGNGTAANARSNAVTVLKNGRMGIGTPTPDAPLHITGAAIATPALQRAYFDASSGTTIVNNTAVTGAIKVHADGWFWADGGGFVATSDARIKHIIGPSNSAEDLDKLSRIAVTDYTYIDQVNHGNTPQKKVIAQQLKQILPEAVNQNKGFIPNVYQTAQQVSFEGNTTLIVTEKAHDLISGDVVKLLVENQSEKILEVTVVDAHTFSVAEVLRGRIFVYGKQVQDLHHVDYDAIAMLNVSATQELAKQIQLLKQNNREKTDEIAELKQKNEQLETKVSEIAELKSQMASLRNLLLTTGAQPQTFQVEENKP